MKPEWIIYIIVAIITGVSCGSHHQSDTNAARVFLYDPQDLAATKKRIQAGDETLLPALDSLLLEADNALQSGPWSVMDKSFTPPSGNKHDYMSVGPYWWPNPETEDGLPYIRKDGLRNPEFENYDSMPLGRLAGCVETLSLAYYFTEHESYAKHAAKLIRVWFLEEETHMNPHLKYGQAIPGRTKGRGIGIIDTYHFVPIADALELLAHSANWTDEDHAAMQKWFGRYLNWLLNSDHGIYAASKHNNHGTFYDIQTSRLAFFVGSKDSIAKEILSQVAEKRIAVQIEPDGSQPLELSRTRAFAYSSANLRGLFRLAILAEHIGLDLWHYSAPDGRNIRTALEFLIPYALQEKEFPYQMIHGWESNHSDKMYFLLRIAAQKYQYPEYEKMIARLPGINKTTNIINLTYPAER